MLNLNEMLWKADVDVNKKIALKKIEIETEAQKAMIRANVATEREMQLTAIVIDKSGVIHVRREKFGDPFESEFPIKVVDYRIFKPYAKNGGILKVILQTYEQHRLQFDLSELDDRMINRKFNSCGIAFGFSHKKETELRRKLVVKLVGLADCTYVPEKRGWNMFDGKLSYVHTDEVIWEEVCNE